MDAVVPGDQTLWKLYSLAEDALFFDEKGRAMDKQALLEDLKPMPKGYSGTIKVTDSIGPVRAKCSDLELRTRTRRRQSSGSSFNARYGTTDTWLYRNGQWQIAASQVLRYYEDPAIGTVADKMHEGRGGHLRISSAADVIVVTRRWGRNCSHNATMGSRCGYCRSLRIWVFRVGAEGRRLFRRDAAGKVMMLVDRRNNEDVLWKKVQ